MLRHFPCANLHPNPTIEGTEAHQHLQDVFFFHRLSTRCGFSKFLTMGEAQAPPNSCGLDADRTFYGARHPAAAAGRQDTGGVGRRQVGQQLFTHPCRNASAFEQLAEHLRFCQAAEGQSGLWSMACASPRVSCDFLSWSLCQQLLPPRMPDLICLSKSDSKPPSPSPPAVYLHLPCHPWHFLSLMINELLRAEPRGLWASSLPPPLSTGTLLSP